MSLKKENEISIKITAKKDGDGIEKTKQEIDSLEASADQAVEKQEAAAGKSQQAQADAAESTTKATEAQVQLTDAVEAATAAQQEQQSAVEKTTSSTAKAEASAEKMAQAQEELAQEVKKATAAHEEQQDAITAVASKQQQVGKSVKQAAASQADYRDQLEKSNSQMEKAAQANGGLSGAIEGVGGASGDAVPNLGAAAQGVSELMLAMKAGLGPIGLIIIGLQLAQVALEKWMSSQEEATEASIEESRAIGEQIQRMRELADELERAEREMRLEESAENVAVSFEKIEERFGKLNETVSKALQAQQAAGEHQLSLLESTLELEREKINVAREAGEISAQEAADRLIALDNQLARERQALATLSAERQIAHARDAKSRAESEVKAMEDALDAAYHEYRGIEAFSLPSEADIAKLESRLNNMESFTQREQESLRAQEQSLTETGQAIRSHLESLGISVEGGWKETLEFARTMQEQQKEAKSILAKKREELLKHDEILSEQELALKQQREKKDLESQLVKATQDRAKREAEAADAAKKDAAEKEAAAKAQEQVREALSQLLESTQTTTQYAENDHRTQTEIWEADKKLLQQREAQLIALRASPNMDAGTMRQINASLKGTRASLKAIEKTMIASRPQAQRFLEELKPIDLKASSRFMQRNIDAAAESYNAIAKNALRAAERGDHKALARYQSRLETLAGTMERSSGYAGHALEQHRAVNEALQKVAKTTRKGLEGETAKERQIRKTKTELGQELTAREKARKAAEDTANAQQDAANQAKKSAKSSKAKGTKHQNQAAQVADLQGQVQSANASVQSLTTHVTQLQSVLTQQNALMGQLTAGMATIVANHNAAVTAHSKKINELSAKIAQMKRS